MAARYDLERLFADLETHLKANLGAELTALNTEKNDGITLVDIEQTAYFLQYLGDRIANFDNFIFYGLDESVTNAVGPGGIKIYNIHVVVVLSDTGNDPYIVKRLLRYQRALTTLLERDWAAIRKSVQFKLTGLAPVPLQLLNRSKPDRAIGVALTVAMD